VVVPFLDAAAFLAEAVDSVRAQTYADWELLLVDDGSTDGSTAIARSYADRSGGLIRYLEHEGHANRGMSTSRNAGVAAAGGELVAFLDADDVWTERKLEEQVEILDHQPSAALVLGATQWWYSWADGSADRDAVRSLGVEPGSLVPPPRMLVPLLRNEAPTVTPALIRRSALERAGGFVEGFRGMYEDQVAFVKICLREPVFVAGECWYRWRQHPASACAVSVRSGDYAVARDRFLCWLENYLGDGGIQTPEVWAALASERRRVRRGSEGVAARTRGLLRRAAHPTRSARRRPRLGDAEATTPISRSWGFDRGLPVDRYYIESFLSRQANDVRGRVLEIGDDAYARRFGGNRVERTDVLAADPGNPKATIVADLGEGRDLGSNLFDCIVFTQTLQFVYDVRAALRTLHQLLRPGGVLLLTAPGTTQSGPDEYADSWYWSFTTRSLRRLLGEVFGERVEVESYGNVLAAVGLLHGLAVEDLRRRDLARHDSAYEVIVAARAVKGGGT
jgi:glycosyltransferase involved in cell wall biosynthesis/SAM-dependent methyltransferase